MIGKDFFYMPLLYNSHQSKKHESTKFFCKTVTL